MRTVMSTFVAAMLLLWVSPAHSARALHSIADVIEGAKTLKPGQFVWTDSYPSAGVTTLLVSIKDQRVYVYRNGGLIGVSTASTGRKGHETPTGTFKVLQKRVKYNSDLYDNAPMPYMQRLTWDGVALHAGNIPGYPASHGCIRLPKAFAKLLYESTTHGASVMVVKEPVYVRPKPPVQMAALDDKRLD